MGWSNGGFMSERLACEAHELWAGICADASSVVIGDTAEGGHQMCDSAFGGGTLDYIHYSGTSDTAVTWVGNAFATPAGTPSALDDIARWAQRLGCSAAFRQTYNDGIFSVTHQCSTQRSSATPTHTRRLILPSGSSPWPCLPLLRLPPLGCVACRTWCGSAVGAGSSSS